MLHSSKTSCEPENAKVNIKKKLLTEFDLHTVIRINDLGFRCAPIVEIGIFPIDLGAQGFPGELETRARFDLHPDVRYVLFS